jgi:hypothetical protein
MECDYIVTVVVIVAVIVILFLIFDSRNRCDYITTKNGLRILEIIKGSDIITVRNINSLLKARGLTQDQINEFYSFLCNTDFSVPGICGLKAREVKLLKYVKSVTCPLWEYKECCSGSDLDITAGDFLLETHSPLECSIKAKERGYKGMAVQTIQGHGGVDGTTKCYGTDKVESCVAPGGGCPSISCSLPNGCFGRNNSGHYNRVGSNQYGSYAVYCVGSTQEELDDCMNA